MKWHQQLFWKVFLSAWLLSTLLMGGLVYGLLTHKEARHWQDLMETRAGSHALLQIERYEHGGEMRRAMTGERHRMPLRITDLASGEEISSFRQPVDPARLTSFELVADSGRRYRVEMWLPLGQEHSQQLLRSLFSLQLLLILVVAALLAFWVSVLVVRPLNQLRQHTRRLYDQQNLSTRAEGHLSQRRDEIGELAREFNRMADFVERTLTSQQELLRDVSHELRAPLARLQVAAGLVEQRLGEADPACARINRECEQLSHLIDELLTLARLQELPSSQAVWALAPMLETLLDDMALLYPDHPLQWQLHPPEQEVSLPRPLLERILGNLLLNALRHTPAGTAVALQAKVEQGVLELRVCDEGPGVADALLPRLFDPFVRGHQDVRQGYGLGLSIVARAVQHLQGELVAENRTDVAQGFCVTVRLPLPV